MSASIRIDDRTLIAGLCRMRFRHMLMLALAVEVLVLGARGAERYRPPGIAVEQTFVEGHVIT